MFVGLLCLHRLGHHFDSHFRKDFSGFLRFRRLSSFHRLSSLSRFHRFYRFRNNFSGLLRMVFYRLFRGDFRRWLRSRGASLESYKEEGGYLHLLSESLSHGHVAIGKPSIRNTLKMKRRRGRYRRSVEDGRDGSRLLLFGSSYEVESKKEVIRITGAAGLCF